MPLNCDFCNKPNPIPFVSFACQSFQLEAFPIASSEGGWLACEDCARLVKEERWDELARKATDNFYSVGVHSLPYEEVYELMRALHRQFQQLRMQTN